MTTDAARISTGANAHGTSGTGNTTGVTVGSAATTAVNNRKWENRVTDVKQSISNLPASILNKEGFIPSHYLQNSNLLPIDKE